MALAGSAGVWIAGRRFEGHLARFEAILARRMTMELSMTIAIGAALAIGQFFTALVIILFVLIAEVLEGMTVGRGRRAIKDLLDLTRIISNKMELERELTDLAALVKTAVAHMLPQAESRGISVDINLPAEPIISART